MPIETPLTLFLGKDQQFRHTVYASGTTLVQIAAGTATPENIAGFTLSWMVKTRLEDVDSRALVTKAGTITGTYGATQATNTQRALVTVDDTDTAHLKACDAFWELARTDAGFETVLAYGVLTLKSGVHR